MNGQTYELLVCCGHGGDACLVAAADESRASDHVSVCGEWHGVRQYDTTKWHSSCPRSSHPRLTCSHTVHHHHHADHSSRPQLTTTHPTRQPHTGEADEMQVRFGTTTRKQASQGPQMTAARTYPMIQWRGNRVNPVGGTSAVWPTTPDNAAARGSSVDIADIPLSC